MLWIAATKERNRLQFHFTGFNFGKIKDVVDDNEQVEAAFLITL